MLASRFLGRPQRTNNLCITFVCCKQCDYCAGAESALKAGAELLTPMSKRCAECGTTVDNDAPYCEACGGRAWRPLKAPRRIDPTFSLVAIVIIVLVVFAWVYLKG
jgi:hypothetical protein